jgi:hypothetical protein
LTGTIHTDYTSWSTQQLGIGLLSCRSPDTVGWALKHPMQPVWIVHCDTSFSCMWLEKERDIPYLDHHGVTLPMVHWSCIYPGVETTFTVVTARKPQASPQEEEQEEDPQENLCTTLVCHPEDRIIYPNNYKRWRYALSSTTAWKPYFRLSPKQKELVDHRYAPRINLAVWSRFPQADVILPSTTSTSLSIFVQQV